MTSEGIVDQVIGITPNLAAVMARPDAAEALEYILSIPVGGPSCGCGGNHWSCDYDPDAEEDDSPRDTDAWVILSDGYYFLKLEGVAYPEGYSVRDAAIYTLALRMVEMGAFPPAWLTGEHGPAVMSINDEIRALHDEGGTHMKDGRA